MDPERRRRLVALGDAHREWVAAATDGAEFRPRKAGSDYPLHYVDVDATADAEQAFTERARKIMGLDPETGHRTA